MISKALFSWQILPQITYTSRFILRTGYMETTLASLALAQTFSADALMYLVTQPRQLRTK